jgi:protein-S-isoprenylcysteine O-methyltransferase Ste14
MNDTTFHILAAAFFTAGLSISIYFRNKAERDSGERVSWKDEGLPMILALRLGGLALWGGAIVTLFNPPWMAWSKLSLPDGLRWAGAGLGLLSVGLIYWLFSSIGSGITPTVATRSNHQLVTHGPYRWVRHPLYTAGTALFIALALLTQSWLIFLFISIGFVLLAVRLPNEEAHLIAKFGDEYRAYMQRTGKFLPRLLR